MRYINRHIDVLTSSKLLHINVVISLYYLLISYHPGSVTANIPAKSDDVTYSGLETIFISFIESINRTQANVEIKKITIVSIAVQHA